MKDYNSTARRTYYAERAQARRDAILIANVLVGALLLTYALSL